MARRLLILAAVALAAAPAATQAARLLHPRLTLSPEPVVVRGIGFHAQERVLVRVYAGGSYSHRVTATTRGTFRAAFPNASVDTCQGYVVTAVGNRGSRASLKFMPECPPPPQPGDDLMPRDPSPKR
jgi:hypothetical protein